MKGVDIYDIETLINCFTYTGIDRDSNEVKQFVIWMDRNDLQDLVIHLKSLNGMIGFNNLKFDYPVLHFILLNFEKFLSLSTKKLTEKIYKKAQEIIGKEYSEIKEAEIIIPQLDILRVWHFDNKARMTSLKKLEIALQFPNVQDMPYSHDTTLLEWNQVSEVLSYNKNDVDATKVFYLKTLEKLDLRRGILQKYGINCMNFSDSKIGEELVLKLYCDHTGKMPEMVRKLRTKRDIFRFRDCIPSYIKFETLEFQELLKYLEGIEVKELKGAFEYTFEYQGFEFDLGTGGLHACIKAGVYESNENEVIVDMDVGSLYPSLAIANNLYPEHLGEEFLEVYEEGIVKPRLKAKKEGDKVMSDGYKLSANSVYGKSNSEYSFLYDPLYTLKTTLAGQLSLCMLSEMLMVRVPNLKMLQVNTDGITVIIPQEHKRLLWEICKEWEAITKLGLEYIAYDKMVIRDVNSYLALTKAGKIKYKGAFKTHPEMIKDGEYHKAFNQGIVPLALSDLYLKGIPVEDTIKNHTNIYDFCKTFNATHGWLRETFLVNLQGEEYDIKPEQKNNRYYLSKEGRRFRKVKEDRKIEIEANRLVTIFNKYEEKSFDEYGVDLEYYIEECYKIIHILDGTFERQAEEARLKREEDKMRKEEENFLKFCINKVPTEKQLAYYRRDWLIEKYGEPVPKPSKITLH